MLNEKQKALGSKVQQEIGLPDQPTVTMGVDSYVKKRTAPLEDENTKLKGLLQQQQQVPQQQQPQEQQQSPFMQMLQSVGSTNTNG